MSLAIQRILSTANREEAPRDTLRIAFSSFPPTLDPLQSNEFVSAQLLCMIYEGLTRSLPDGSASLALAKSVEISPDQKIYRFQLRPAQWSDGSYITAHDFIASWQKVLNPLAPSPCAYLLYPIQNAEAAVRGELPISDVGICAIDETTLELQLHHPAPRFLERLSLSTFFPTRGNLYNGPFVIDKIQQNQEIQLVKNPYFWNAAKICLEHIHIAIVPDSMTMLHLFEQGMLDWIGGPLAPIPLDALPDLRTHQSKSLSFLPASATTFCTFNTETFPFSNENLRKAFAYAINLNQIVDHIGQGISPEHFIPPILYKEPPPPRFHPYQPERAHMHLQKALQELQISRQEIGSLTLQHRSGPLERQIAVALAHQWKTVLDIDIALEQVDVQTQRDRLQRRDYQLSLALWIAQYHDPMNILERFQDRHHAKNYPSWENPRFTELLQAANSSSIGEMERLALMEEAEKILIEEMPLVPIYHWSYPCLRHPRITHLDTLPCGAVLFESTQIAP